MTLDTQALAKLQQLREGTQSTSTNTDLCQSDEKVRALALDAITEEVGHNTITGETTWLDLDVDEISLWSIVTTCEQTLHAVLPDKEVLGTRCVDDFIELLANIDTANDVTSGH